jgi:glycosyltransferase involved in cell wall biosynthesis
MWTDAASIRMKVLFVHERFGAFAGAESNILATAGELKQRGYTVGILHGTSTGKGEEVWRETFRDFFPVGGPRTGVSAAVAAFQPDVLYVHKMSDLTVLEELLASHVPVVRMVHDHDLYCMRSYKYNYLTRGICDRPLSPYCVFPCGACVVRNREGGFPVQWVSYTAKVRELQLNRKFQHLVVATQFMKRELLRNGVAEDRIEIHSPVPAAAEAEIHSNFSDRNRIIYSGQITRGKGVDVLLEALALVRVPFECLIFGDGNHRAFCEKLCRRLGLDGRVQFKGYVSPETIVPCYQECSVVVMSSVWPEPFGAAGLEGMRYGLPVVAFDAGGIGEWLIDGFNGSLVPWMDRAAFADRVETLLRDKSLARELGANGRRTVDTQYKFSKYIDGLENLFTRTAQASPLPA